MNADRLRDELAACHEEAFLWAMHCARRDRERAEDVLQAAYLKVLDGRARFEGRSAFRTWLFGVIRRTAAEEWRRGLLTLGFLSRQAVEPSSRQAEDDSLEVEERQGALLRALAQLSSRQREVLVLVFYHELTVEEAAEVMGVGVGSARTHYARGKERLRTMLKELE